MQINIGNKIFDVLGIVYVSPTGNDSNDGLTVDTPVKSIARYLAIAQNNYAIFFMSGTHEFVDEFIDEANMKFFRDNGKQLLFYSKPYNTKIILKATRGTPSYSRQQFFSLSSTAHSKIINLNIECIGQGSDTGYNCLSVLHNGYFYNTHIKVTSQWSTFRFSHHTRTDDIIMQNCIVSFNQPTVAYVTDGRSRMVFNSSVITDWSTDTLIQYSIKSPNIYNMTLEDILNTNWGSGDPAIENSGIGLKYGPYSEWFEPAKYCFHDKDTNEDFYFDDNLKVLTDMHSPLFNKDNLYSNLSLLIADVPKLAKKYYNIKMIKEK